MYDLMRCLKESDINVCYCKILATEDGSCEIDLFLKDSNDPATSGRIGDDDLLQARARRGAHSAVPGAAAASIAGGPDVLAALTAGAGSPAPRGRRPAAEHLPQGRIRRGLHRAVRDVRARFRWPG